jgi:hypothetical protein
MRRDSILRQRRRWRAALAAAAVALSTIGLVGFPDTASAVVTETPIDSDSPDHPVGPTGRVNAIVRKGNRIYIGGDFTSVGGQSRSYLAAINRATGQVDATWTPTADQPVDAMALAPDGSVLYVAGRFKTINGLSRVRLAALDPVTGAPTGWNPEADKKVRALVATEDVVYVAGNFQTINGTTAEHLAAIDTSTADLVPGWDVSTNERVLDLELDAQGVLYVAGKFDRVNGVLRHQLAAVNVATETVTSFNPNVGFDVLDVELSDDEETLFAAIGGAGTAGGNIAAAYRTSNGTERWSHVADGDFQAVAVAPDTVYFGGHFGNIGPKVRLRIASMDPMTGAISKWNPGMDSGFGVWDLVYDKDRLLVGGDFSRISGVSQPHFAMLREQISFAGSDATKGKRRTFTVSVPSKVGTDDGMLLFVTVNKTSAGIMNPTGLTGWTKIGRQIDGTVKTAVYKRVAGASDAGTTVTVKLTKKAKATVVLAAYRGTAADPVYAWDADPETTVRSSHTTPIVSHSGMNALVVSYWAEKGPDTTTITPPEGVIQRSTRVGEGVAHIGMLLADSGTTLEPDDQGGLTATSDASTGKATMWTILLAPAL